MSAECEECGFDLVGSQYDERGLWCVPCDLKSQLEEAQRVLGELVARIKIQGSYIKDSQAFKDAQAVVSRVSTGEKGEHRGDRWIQRGTQ